MMYFSIASFPERKLKMKQSITAHLPATQVIGAANVATACSNTN